MLGSSVVAAFVGSIVVSRIVGKLLGSSLAEASWLGERVSDTIILGIRLGISEGKSLISPEG